MPPSRSVFFLAALILFSGTAQAEPQFDRYFRDTAASLECLRSPSGLVADKGIYDPSLAEPCPVRIIHAATTPTNIAFDLLVQAESQEWTRIDRILRALDRMPRMPGTALYFSLYSTVQNTPEVLDPQVSAIDNFHLALALWSLSRLATEPRIRTRAAGLFGRMDFSVFYDGRSGLIFGNLRPVNHSRWKPDSWHYGDLGSESRSLYTAGYALGLFAQTDFLDRGFAALDIELSADRRLMHLWDGGVFQLFLPDLLLDEQSESRALGRAFRGTSELLVTEAAREGDALPAAYSACQLGEREAPVCDGLPCYNGKAGLPDLVSSANADFRVPELRRDWDIAVPAYGLMLAARTAGDHYATALERSERLGGKVGFYRSGLGFLDAYFTKGAAAGSVVPAVLALDQEILALAARTLMNGGARSFSARALRSDARVAARLAQAYAAFDGKYARTGP